MWLVSTPHQATTGSSLIYVLTVLHIHKHFHMIKTIDSLGACILYTLINLLI
jgi:hypothetical protein